jgi:hypothetical protein
VTISVLATAALLKAVLAMTATAAAATTAKHAAERRAEQNDRREALAKSVGIEIAASRERIKRLDASAALPLTAELERITSMAGDAPDEKTTPRVLDALNALATGIRAAEIDASLLDERREKIKYLTRTVTSYGDAGYDAELADMTRRAAGLSSTPLDEAMREARKIIDRLLEMDAALSHRPVSPPVRSAGTAADAEMAERVRQIDEIRDLAGRVTQLDPAETERLTAVVNTLTPDTQFPERIASLARQMRTEWATVRERAAATAYFRETLTALNAELAEVKGAISSPEGAILARRCASLLAMRFIGRVEFMALYEDIARFVRANEKEITETLLTGRVTRAMSKLGYELISDGGPEPRPGDVRYLETPYDGYRVMVKAQGGEVAARLARVGDEAAGAEERAADAETGKKGCRDFDKFLEEMKNGGLPLDVTVRQEPGERPLLAIKEGKGAPAARKKTRRSRGRSVTERGEMRSETE